METQFPISVLLNYFSTILLLLLICGCPLRSSNALHNLGDSTQHPYGSIFSPLFKALSEHGASRWSADLKKRMKPEHKYMKYMTELYKKSSRVERSLDENNLYNTVRLIKPRDECLHQSKEFFMQDLSYNLDRVKDKEQLLKSVLLYSFDQHQAASVTSVCYLNIKEQEYSNQCQLCPSAHHTANFTLHTHRRRRKNWVEVDVTSFFHPLFKFQKKNLHLLINLTCTDDQGTRSNTHKGPVKLTLRPPPLLLYLNDTSKVAHQRLLFTSKAGQRQPTASNTIDKQMQLKPEQRIVHKRRRRRDSPKSKRGGQSLDLHLPDLLPSSEFPTSDCALYDFRVRFSQLKLDHWIVFPPKYNPRYCRGICPRTMGFIYGSPVHTMVQNIIYERLDSSVPRPSCIPSHYSPLSVMIFEEDGSYVYKEFEDMVATRCTCR
ncbi:growth/differentiatio [Polymixia lowei]